MKQVIVLLFFILFTSCADENRNIESESATPLSLTENAGDYEMDIFSRSNYSGDIIQRLYDESLEIDIELEKLDNRINGFERIRHDTILAFQNYVSINENYWKTLDRYLSNISDTLLRENSKNLFATFEKDYQLSIEPHLLKVKSINEKQLELKDQALLLKLSIASATMMNYQKNELPDVAAMEKIILELQALIDEVKQFHSN